nr:uncharacterized protein LOC117274571 [Nicotiana tomentosiformis]
MGICFEVLDRRWSQLWNFGARFTFLVVSWAQRHNYCGDFTEDYHKRVKEWQQTQLPSTQPTPDDMASLWTEAAGGVSKGRVYGLGVRRLICHPNPLLPNSSSSQNQE